MNHKLLIGILIVGLLAVGCVSAMTVSYYHHPNCNHCQKINPIIETLILKYKDMDWRVLDTSTGSYAIDGTPTLIINTDDNREIKIIGSQEIPRWLECELNEQSNLNCPTYSSTEGVKDGSWFIK